MIFARSCEKTISMRPANLFILAALCLFAACDRPPKGDNATITEEQKAANGTETTYQVDTSESRIRFIGYGVGKNHPGRFKLSSGTVTISGNQVTGGDFVINIKSLDVEQKEAMF